MRGTTILAFASVLVAACGSQGPTTPTNVPAHAPAVASTAPEPAPQPTPAPSPDPVPTPTPPPAAAPTPIPSPTPTPSPSPKPAPLPQPSPTPAAPVAPSNTFSGFVRDGLGGPIANASLFLSAASNGSFTVVTDSAGRYQFQRPETSIAVGQVWGASGYERVVCNCTLAPGQRDFVVRRITAVVLGITHTNRTVGDTSEEFRPGVGFDSGPSLWSLTDFQIELSNSSVLRIESRASEGYGWLAHAIGVGTVTVTGSYFGVRFAPVTVTVAPKPIYNYTGAFRDDRGAVLPGLQFQVGSSFPLMTADASGRYSFTSTNLGENLSVTEPHDGLDPAAYYRVGPTAEGQIVVTRIRSLSINAPSQISVSGSALTIRPISVSIDGGYPPEWSSRVQWVSSDPTIVSLQPCGPGQGEPGCVVGKAIGSATITATYFGVNAPPFKIQVTP
jgi:hypothetical protein